MCDYPDEYKALKHGDRVEMFWHFHSTSGDYIWKPGKVFHAISGNKLFLPDGSKVLVLILPHRMDEIRNNGA